MRRPDTDAGDLIEELVADLGMPTRLRDVGVRRDQFAAIAAASMQSMMVKTNPRPITGPEQILEILEELRTAATSGVQAASVRTAEAGFRYREHPCARPR